MPLLTLHYYVGFAVVALALLAIWRRPERRITLYVVTLQIVIGVILVIQHLRAPSLHYALAILGWAGYMVANAFARRPERARLALVIAAVSSILLLIGFSVGMQAVKAGG
jgi:membrane-associated PAP2 superfamily phosphatase